MAGEPDRSVNKMMKFVPVVGLAVLLVGCVTADRPTEATALRSRLFTAPFREARNAGNLLLRLSMFKSESRTTQDEVVRFFGRPDRVTNDAVCYKTNGGPLWIEFSNGVLVNAVLVAPPRWRGTDEELEAWWEEARNQDNWDQY